MPWNHLEHEGAKCSRIIYRLRLINFYNYFFWTTDRRRPGRGWQRRYRGAGEEGVRKGRDRTTEGAKKDVTAEEEDRGGGGGGGGGGEVIEETSAW
jgi:hypothetical protein